MQPVDTRRQVALQQNPHSASQTEANWMSAWCGHVISKCSGSLHNFATHVDHIVNPPLRKIETPFARLPTAVLARIAILLAPKDATWLFRYFSEEEKAAVIKNNSSLVSTILKKSNGDIRSVPAGWRRAIIHEVANITSLDLHGIAIRAISIKKMVRSFCNLKEINLEDCSLSDLSLMYLSRHRLLEKVNIDKNSAITESGIARIFKMQALKKLREFQSTNCSELTDQVLDQFALMENLRVLHLKAAPFSAKALADFKQKRPDIHLEI